MRKHASCNIAASLVLTLFAGCTYGPDSWNSPRMAEIKREWQSSRTNGSRTKDEYGELVTVLDAILAKDISYRNVRHLAATCGTLAKTERERSAFENAVLEHMVRVLVDAADRENLLKLLSIRCPNHVYDYETIEHYLAFRGQRLKDAILILGEAYQKCESPEVRHVIAVAVRRGFTDPDIHGQDESEFVVNAMRWYQKNQRELVFNERYGGQSLAFPTDGFLPDDAFEDHHEPFHWQPLYVNKTAPDGGGP
jgi:hypothetical protein